MQMVSRFHMTIRTIQCPLKWSVTLKPKSSMQNYENRLQWIKMNWLHNMVKLWAERQMSVELQPAVQSSRVELSSAYEFDIAANRCIVAIIILMNSCKCKLQIYRCNDNDFPLLYKNIWWICLNTELVTGRRAGSSNAKRANRQRHLPSYCNLAYNKYLKLT